MYADQNIGLRVRNGVNRFFEIHIAPFEKGIGFMLLGKLVRVNEKRGRQSIEDVDGTVSRADFRGQMSKVEGCPRDWMKGIGIVDFGCERH